VGWRAISVDILPFGRRAQLSRESAAKQRSTRNGRFAAAFWRLEVSQAHIHQKTAGTLVGNGAGGNGPIGRESLRILKNRYGAGLATITDLLRAEDAERQSHPITGTPFYGSAMAIPNFYSRLGH